MSRPAIFLDVDGILLDWYQSFDRWLISERGIIPLPHPARDAFYTDKLPDLSYEEIVALIAEFNDSDAFGQLAEIDGAREVVSRLKQVYCDRKLVAVTSAGVSPASLRRRLDNLKMFPLDDFYSLPLKTPKARIMELYGSDSILIEDTAGNAALAQEVGCRAILMNRSYNEHLPAGEAIRVDDWRQAELAVRRLIGS